MCNHYIMKTLIYRQLTKFQTYNLGSICEFTHIAFQIFKYV